MITHVSHIVHGRFHPGVTTQTRMLFNGPHLPGHQRHQRRRARSRNGTGRGPAELTWRARSILTGVDELLAELARLAPDLTAEARTLQQSIATDTAAAHPRRAMPAVTGRAAGQCRRSNARARPVPRACLREVAVTAPYAHFRRIRHRATRRPTPAFVPITRLGRERFADAVIGRVKRARPRRSAGTSADGRCRPRRRRRDGSARE